MLMIAPSSNSMFSGLSESTGGEKTFWGRLFGGMVSDKYNYENYVINRSASENISFRDFDLREAGTNRDEEAQKRSDEGWQRHWNKTMENGGYNNGVPGNAPLTAQPVIPAADVQPFPVATPRVPGG